MRANPHYAPREGAEAIPFRPGDDRSREIVTVPRDASYEHALDEDAPGSVPVPDGDDIAHRHSAGSGCWLSPSTCRRGKACAPPSANTSTPTRFHTQIFIT